ncbi:MAG TPA: FkbM family methyltransferase [Gaiellaceae bacterium]
MQAPLRTRARRALGGLLARLPRGGVGDVVRFALIRLTKQAPLGLAIARGDTVVQVGAVGDGEVWRMAQLVGPTGRVVVVEAFPQNAKEIEDRLAAAGIVNVLVIAKGAWSSSGSQTLYVHPDWHASNIVLDSGAKHDRALSPEQYAGAVEIEVDRLDDLLAEHGIDRCDFAKVTVMGAELHVLEGMTELLQADTTLWVKAHSDVDGAPANSAIAAMLSERGFRTVIVRGNRGPDGHRRPGDVYAAPRGRRSA